MSEVIADMEALIKMYESWKKSEGIPFNDAVGDFLLKYADKYKKIK